MAVGGELEYNSGITRAVFGRQFRAHIQVNSNTLFFRDTLLSPGKTLNFAAMTKLFKEPKISQGSRIVISSFLGK